MPDTLKIMDLYELMPGAPPVPRDGWNMEWDGVIGNDHWKFCEAIVRTMEETVKAVLLNATR